MFPDTNQFRPGQEYANVVETRKDDTTRYSDFVFPNRPPAIVEG